MEIGTLLRRARKNKDMTLKELSTITKISFSYLSTLERGQKTNIGREHILLISKALNLSPLIFFPEYKQIDVNVEYKELIEKIELNEISIDQLNIAIDFLLRLKGTITTK